MLEENEAEPFVVEWTDYDSSRGQVVRRSCIFARLEDAEIEAKRLNQEHRCMVTVHTGNGSAAAPKVFHLVIEPPPEE